MDDGDLKTREERANRGGEAFTRAQNCKEGKNDGRRRTLFANILFRQDAGQNHGLSRPLRALQAKRERRGCGATPLCSPGAG